MTPRCAWAQHSPLECDYHDQEWGVPLYDDTRLFEFLILEGAQAGLSWRTILVRREGYRQAFDQFNASIIANYSAEQQQTLLGNPNIIRNRLKIQAAISNARAYLQVQSQFGSFANYIWQFVDGQPITNHWPTQAEVPSTTAQSRQMSADLKRRGFRFVGDTICYAYMQAVGMVNDHTTHCYRHQEIQALQDKRLLSRDSPKA